MSGLQTPPLRVRLAERMRMGFELAAGRWTGCLAWSCAVRGEFEDEVFSLEAGCERGMGSFECHPVVCVELCFGEAPRGPAEVETVVPREGALKPGVRG